MIYFHDSDGSVTNTYQETSGIEYILEYDCRGRHINMSIDTRDKRFIHVACPDEHYMDDWVKRHEVVLPVLHDWLVRYTTPDLCVSVGDGDFSVFMRSPVRIDWVKDYHFYPNRSYESTRQDLH